MWSGRNVQFLVFIFLCTCFEMKVKKKRWELGRRKRRKLLQPVQNVSKHSPLQHGLKFIKFLLGWKSWSSFNRESLYKSYILNISPSYCSKQKLCVSFLNDQIFNLVLIKPHGSHCNFVWSMKCRSWQRVRRRWSPSSSWSYAFPASGKWLEKTPVFM